jgi:hypothetical protein
MDGREARVREGQRDSDSDQEAVFLRRLFERYHTALEEIVAIGSRDEPPAQRVVQMQRRAMAALSEDVPPPKRLSEYAALHPMAGGRRSGAERAASEPPSEPNRDVEADPDAEVDA